MDVVKQKNSSLTPQAVQAKLDEALVQHDSFLSKVGVYESDTNSAEREAFLVQLKKWFKRLRPLSSQLQTTDQYATLNGIASDWQTALTLRFNCPINVWDELGLTMPSADLKPQRPRANPQQILQMISDRAYETSVTRKLSHL